jgi:hypothetical protein
MLCNLWFFDGLSGIFAEQVERHGDTNANSIFQIPYVKLDILQ